MKQFRIYILLLACLLMTACDDKDEQSVSPIRFGRQDYTVKCGIPTSISYVDGSDVYEIEIGNKDVLNRADIDIETHRLIVQAVRPGESTVTIKDVRADASVTLRIEVLDFYLGFHVKSISGENTNSYITQGCELRFVRAADDRKLLNVIFHDNLRFTEKKVADGIFEMIKGDDGFMLEMALHHKENEELEPFRYSVESHYGVFASFEHWFDYNWKIETGSRRSLVEPAYMILTDESNGCKIDMYMLPLNQAQS